MEFLLGNWPRLIICVFNLLLSCVVIRTAIAQFFIFKVLREDVIKFCKSPSKDPFIIYNRYVKINFLLMVFQFWVWPLSRYLPKEEEDDPSSVSG